MKDRLKPPTTRIEQIGDMYELSKLVQSAQQKIQGLQDEISRLHGKIEYKEFGLARFNNGFTDVIEELEDIQLALNRATIEHPEAAAMLRPHEHETERYLQELKDIVNRVIPKHQAELASALETRDVRLATLEEIQREERTLSERLQAISDALGTIDLI